MDACKDASMLKSSILRLLTCSPQTGMSTSQSSVRSHEICLYDRRATRDTSLGRAGFRVPRVLRKTRVHIGNLRGARSLFLPSGFFFLPVLDIDGVWEDLGHLTSPYGTREAHNSPQISLNLLLDKTYKYLTHRQPKTLRY